jgi:hypothetical protein
MTRKSAGLLWKPFGTGPSPPRFRLSSDEQPTMAQAEPSGCPSGGFA